MHKLGFLGVGLIIINLIVWAIIKKNDSLYSGLYKSVVITLIVIGLALIVLKW